MADWTEFRPVVTWRVWCPRCDKTWLRDTEIEAREDARGHDKFHATQDEEERKGQ